MNGFTPETRGFRGKPVGVSLVYKQSAYIYIYKHIQMHIEWWNQNLILLVVKVVFLTTHSLKA